MITIAYTLGEGLKTVTPSKRQYAGIMGEQGGCAVTFRVPTTYASGYRVRLEFVDATGKFFTTDEAEYKEHLTQSGEVFYCELPKEWTVYGGTAHVRLVACTTDDSGEVKRCLKSPDCALLFDNSCEARDIMERRSLAQLIVDGRGITESAKKAIEDANEAAESARDAHGEAYAAASAATATARELQEMAENGEFDGSQGIPGVSPTVEVNDIEGGHRVAITDVQGVHTFDVMDGEVVGGVQSVNGKTGTVQLTASDVGASPAETWNGKPVYTKLVDCGETGTSDKYVDTGVSLRDYDIIGFEGYLYGTLLIVAKRANVQITNASGDTDSAPNYYIRVMDTAGILPDTCKVRIQYVAK